MKEKLGRNAGLGFFAIGVACFLLAGLLVYKFSGRFVDTPSGAVAGPAHTFRDRSDVRQDTAPADPAAGGGARTEPREESHWVLYITGEVRNPGVYNLPPGSRVFQLVEAAGGIGPQADPVRINMASPLADGMHIHVPSIRPGGGIMDIPEGSAHSLMSLAPSMSPSGGHGAMVNVNSASAAELQTLPGIGPVTARAIIEHRERVGPFRSLESLMDVSGIGPKKLEAIRGMVVVQ
ncbi:MAG: ComEA family DNA-binding protein [Synergistaceae bacterium]|nr:ComEA family DNA-binding protein [Synergistota bacterium]NLM70708.1 ComEA family DNA-binding protein [Synergistaceae bacterium]